LGNRTWLHIGIAVGLHVASFYIRSFDLFSDLFYFYMYFLTGALLSGTLVTTAKREKILNTSYIKWVIPFFVAGQIFWFIHSERTDFYEVFFVVINFIGCYFLFLCSVLLARHTTNEWLAYIGRYSLYIYILHVQIAAIVRKIIVTVFPNVNTGLLLAICFMCGIILPILIINHFKKFGIKKLFVLETEKSSRPYES
jgi:peptidoglycan/LPS O-acetylase OafA/YrhL